MIYITKTIQLQRALEFKVFGSSYKYLILFFMLENRPMAQPVSRYGSLGRCKEPYSQSCIRAFPFCRQACTLTASCSTIKHLKDQPAPTKYS
jgi:hypothetical protein